MFPGWQMRCSNELFESVGAYLKSCWSTWPTSQKYSRTSNYLTLKVEEGHQYFLPRKFWWHWKFLGIKYRSGALHLSYWFNTNCILKQFQNKIFFETVHVLFSILILILLCYWYMFNFTYGSCLTKIVISTNNWTKAKRESNLIPNR